MTPLKLAGIALYSDDLNEIESAIRENIETDNEYLFAECAHAVGHVARRFKKDLFGLRQSIIRNAGKFTNSGIVVGGLNDMKEDINYFCRRKK